MLKNRTYVALAALVLVGGAAVWKLTRPDPHAAVTPAGAAAWNVKKEDVDEIEIAEPKKPVVQLKKEGAEWKLVQPVADRADQKAAEQAVDALATLKLRDVIAESPESYDKVEVKDEDVVKVVPKKAGKPLGTLLVGKKTNVRLEGDPKVWATADLKRWALVKEPRMWRDRSIVEIPADKLDHVELTYPGGAKIVARKEKKEAPASQPAGAQPPPATGPDKWIVTEGQDRIGGPVDDGVATNLASTLSRLEAEDFADGLKPADAGLDRPRVTVAAALPDGTAKTLLIGRDEGQSTYAMLAGGDRVWKIRKYEADRFPSSPVQWRDKTIVRLEPSQVTKIELVKDKDRVVLERVDADSFKATAPAGLGEIDQGAVTSMLHGLTALRAAHIVEGADVKAAGLTKPTAVATFWKKDGSTVKLTIGAEKAKEYTVQASTVKDLYALSDFQAKLFMKSASDLKKKAAAAPARPGGM